MIRWTPNDRKPAIGVILPGSTMVMIFIVLKLIVTQMMWWVCEDLNLGSPGPKPGMMPLHYRPTDE